MQISWPSLVTAAIVAGVVSSIASCALQPKVGPPGPPPRVLLAWLALRDHKAPRGRLDRKAFQDLPRRAAASVYQLVCAAIVWAEQFSPATDCR